MAPRWNYLRQTRIVLRLLGVDISRDATGLSPKIVLELTVFIAIQLVNSYGTMTGGLQEDFSAMVISLTWTFVAFMTISKYFYIQLSWRFFYEDLLDFVDDWYTQESDLANTFYLIIESSQFFCWMTAVWYLSFPLFTGELPPAPYAQPWDQNSTLGWAASYLFMLLTLVAQMFITTAVDFTIMVCGIAFKNRLDSVGADFRRVNGSDDLPIAIQAVQHHQEILRKVKLLEAVLSASFLFQVANTVICTCFCTYSALRQQSEGIEPFLRVLIIAVSAFSICLMYCWVGQSITNACENLHFAVYNNMWYISGREIQKFTNIVLLYTAGQSPLPKTALISMSFTTFSAVVQNSYQYLMVLMRMTNKD